MISRSVSALSNSRILILLFLIAAFNYVYLKHTLNESNPANRVALCLALWEDGSPIIDKYHHFSVDQCFRDGHYYCDKAPGVSFLALPFVVAGYEALKAVGRTENLSAYDPDFPVEPFPEPNVNYKILMIAGSFVVSLIGAAAVCVMFLLLLRAGLSSGAAVFGALVMGFGTPFGVWSTVMFGHAPGGAFLLFGTALSYFLLTGQPGDENKPRKTVLWILAGFFLAYAVWIEYTSAVPACILGATILCVLKAKGRTLASVSGTAGLLFLGALPVALGFFVYNTIAFGGPLTIGYKFVTTNFPKMSEGFYGVRLPDFHVLFLTLFSPQHGILWFSPVLILSPILAFCNIYHKRFPALNVACLLITAYYFLMNSSYAYWMQTYVSGRHVTAGLPFMVLPIFLAWPRLGKTLRLFTVALAGIGLVIGFMSINVPASTAMQAAPFKIIFITKEFLAGHIRNLLYYVGVTPRISLLVFMAVWGVFLVILFRLLASGNRTVPDPSSTTNP